MTALEVQDNIFNNPARYLLLIWRYAGPACCLKSSGLARHAGICCKSSGAAGRQDTFPWKEWWPDLARCTFSSQLISPAGDVLSLDRVWVLIHAHPGLVNTPLPIGRPIVVALRNGRRDIAALLRLSGGFIRGAAADELLYDAAASGNPECIKCLLYDSFGRLYREPWASVNARPKRHGGTPVDIAKARGHVACAELLRKAGGRHSLHAAAMYAESNDISAWLTEGGNVDECDSSGATPLWHAVHGVTHGFGRSCSSASKERSDRRGIEDESCRSCCIKLLLEAQATVDALPISLETPLLVAARRGSVQHCSQLLHARANLETRNRDGRTPLDCAASDEVRRLLIESRSAASRQPSDAQTINVPHVDLSNLSFYNSAITRTPGSQPVTLHDCEVQQNCQEVWAWPYYTSGMPCSGPIDLPVSSVWQGVYPSMSPGMTALPYGEPGEWSDAMSCIQLQSSKWWG